MLRIAFNYHDHVVQLRFIALAALAVMVSCLAAVEFRADKSLRLKIALTALMGLCLAVIAYVIISLQGA